jgi:hypothetical protein
MTHKSNTNNPVDFPKLETEMNERIKQLAEQAEKYADYNFKGESFWSEAYESKFAELIVRECLDQCYNRGMNDELYNGQLKAAAYIEQHFGVE